VKRGVDPPHEVQPTEAVAKAVAIDSCSTRIAMQRVSEAMKPPESAYKSSGVRAGALVEASSTSIIWHLASPMLFFLRHSLSAAKITRCDVVDCRSEHMACRCSGRWSSIAHGFLVLPSSHEAGTAAARNTLGPLLVAFAKKRGLASLGCVGRWLVSRN